eukprot:3076619-Alexandrium_andersonii.AAC.1
MCIRDSRSHFLLADAVGREAALLQLQERSSEEFPLEEGAPTLVAIGATGAFLQGLCTAVA